MVLCHHPLPLIRCTVHGSDVTMSFCYGFSTPCPRRSNSAEKTWNDLKEMFAQSNHPRIFQIRKNIASLTQEAFSVQFLHHLLHPHPILLAQDLSNWRTIGVAKQSQGLYHLIKYICSYLQIYKK
ncbi:uncharacterized protein LOC122310920 isoform X2 [Carya illinoinensis]|uniref:uncharacterized protein LOC122310920 isoform X2 n=2 Tax=Carya illinoinensis TaxID=32201 RepID=UPI001C717E23|nr:uncharacterized protein LOC122310920 isoform X2 [Carya illinoinensis]